MTFIERLRSEAKEVKPGLDEEQKKTLESWFSVFSFNLACAMEKEAKKGKTSIQITDRCLSKNEVNYLYKHYRDEGFKVKISEPYCVYGESTRLITISWEEPICL